MDAIMGKHAGTLHIPHTWFVTNAKFKPNYVESDDSDNESKLDAFAEKPGSNRYDIR